MPEYKYRGMLRNGKILRGVMTAKNRHEVIVKLKNSRVQPIKVKSLKTLKFNKTLKSNKNLANKEELGWTIKQV